jgi:hypothetical protein
MPRDFEEVEDYFSQRVGGGVFADIQPRNLFAGPEPTFLEEVVVTGRDLGGRISTDPIVPKGLSALTTATRFLNPLLMLFTPGNMGPRGTGELQPGMVIDNTREAPDVLEEVVVNPPGGKPPRSNSPAPTDPFDTPNWDELANDPNFDGRMERFDRWYDFADELAGRFETLRRTFTLVEGAYDFLTRDRSTSPGRGAGTGLSPGSAFDFESAPQRNPKRQPAPRPVPGLPQTEPFFDPYQAPGEGPGPSLSPRTQPLPSPLPDPSTGPNPSGFADPFVFPLNPPRIVPLGPNAVPLGPSSFLDPHDPSVGPGPGFNPSPGPNLDPFEEPFSPKPPPATDQCACDKEPKKKKKKKSEPRTVCYSGTYRQLKKGIIYNRGKEVPCDAAAPRRAAPKVPRNMKDLTDIVFGI